MTDHKGILICSEITKDLVPPTAKELLNTGKRLCTELKEPLSILLIGENIQKAAQEAITLGADIVYISKWDSFVESPPEDYLTIICEICKKINPGIILFSHTDMGREIAPRLAAKLKAGTCLDCTELAIDSETRSLLQTKPVYGGNAVAIWASEHTKPQVVTMRPRADEPAQPDPDRKGETISFSVKIEEAAGKSKILETVKEEAKGMKLEEAKIIVSGGGGIGGKEGFQLLQELAQILGGTIGITRVPRDEGWMPVSLEIGQTGHVVSPDLYIAVGISGAPQHLAGCSSAKCIVAINKDPQAHIFQEADFGIIGDYRKILPPLIDKIKALL
jgi:electron transfer flavoprotein alpha subunit